MTRKELNRFANNCTTVKKGYCCYQEDGLSRRDLVEIGTNCGIYGWNWTCFYNMKSDTCYISGYRNY